MSETRRRKRLTEQTEQITDKQELLALIREAVASSNEKKPAGLSRPGENADGIDLLGLFWHIMSKVHFVLLAAIIGAIGGYYFAQKTYVPSYKATAKLYVVSSGKSVINVSDLSLGNALTSDYIEAMKTWEVSEMVREALNIKYSYSALQSKVKFSNPAGSHLLYITATSNNAQEAADIANAYAEAGRKFIYKNMTSEEPNSFSIALIPGAPSSGGKSQYTLYGFLLGSVLVLGILMLQFLLDNHPRTADDITKCSGLVTLAVIPVEESNLDAKKAYRKKMKKSAAERGAKG